MSLLKARQEINDKLTIIRSIDRIVNSEKFDILYSHANEQDEQIIHNALKILDKDALLNWIKSKSRQINYNEVGIKELHSMARRMGIKNYTRLPKALLLFEINSQKVN